MATYIAQKVGSAGLAATYNAADPAGDRVSPGTLLHVKNANVSAANLTVATPKVFDGDLTVADRVVNVPASTGERFVRVPNSTIYVAADGLVDISWDITPSVTFAVLE